MKELLFIYGTRPEAIKFAPIINLLNQAPYNQQFRYKICTTEQHKEMLDQVHQFFKIQADIRLSIMTPNQTLFDIVENTISELKKVFLNEKPDYVCVQGDTSTAFAGALAAYYSKIPVIHIEAGLRSHDHYLPFPEEMNRKLIAQLASIHFAPTELAVNNLKKEGITHHVSCVGNTAIDALLLGLSSLDDALKTDICKTYFSSIDLKKPTITITCHRRESFGPDMLQIFKAISCLAQKHKHINFIYPVHLNPNVQKPAIEYLGQVENIYLLKPLPYHAFIFLLNQSKLILTDSGGIQEEAPSLQVPVLVLRNETERQEGIDAGVSKLIGVSTDTIIDAVEKELSEPVAKDSVLTNPYGDGKASNYILETLVGL